MAMAPPQQMDASGISEGYEEPQPGAATK